MKVISYSIFGKEKIYRNGLIANIEISKNLFPDWKVLVHLDPTNEDQEFLSKINQPHVEIVEMISEHHQDGFLWRILPLEENYEAVIVRDVDTRLFKRDKELVDLWLATDFKYHVCRDNISSFQTMLGGLWGGRNSKLKISKYWKTWRDKQAGNNLWDIGFLKKYIYPQIRSNLLVFTEHNIYFGEKNIYKLGERGNYKGRSIILGMVVEEDFENNDSKLPNNRNSERLKLNYFNHEILKDPNHKLIKTYYPRYFFPNFFFNSIYLFLIFTFFLINYKETKIFTYLKYKFLSLFSKKKYNSELTKYALFN